MIRHGSLESGIGMFDYAAEKVGWENVFHCEINEFCQTILKYYWPKAKSYANVFEFNGNEWRGKVDVITCGFPCQPFSHAGKRKGSSDDRFIWPENLRIIREAKPSFVLAENVPGLITIENGVVFEQVCLDLENEGYEVTPFIIPAVATNKDHRRDRIWIVAYSSSINSAFLPIQQRRQSPAKDFNIDREITNAANVNNCNVLSIPGELNKITTKKPRISFNSTNVTDALCIGSQRQRQYRGQFSTKENEDRQTGRTFNGGKLKETWLEAATRLCSVVDGDSGRLDREAVLKATGAKSKKGSHFNRWRTQSLMAAGNTIVPDIAIKFFQAMEAFAQQQ